MRTRRRPHRDGRRLRRPRGRVHRLPARRGPARRGRRRPARPRRPPRPRRVRRLRTGPRRHRRPPHRPAGLRLPPYPPLDRAPPRGRPPPGPPPPPGAGGGRPGGPAARRPPPARPPPRAPAPARPADDSLWQAVDAGETERLCALLGTSDTAAVEALLPHLAAWRDRQDSAHTAAGSLYAESWQPVTPPATAPDLTGDWLLATPAGPAATPLTDALARALTDAGGTVHPLPAADDRTAYAHALDALAPALDGRPPRAVLALTALAPEPAAGAVTPGATRTLALVQALGDSGLAAPLWLLTQGAVRTGDADPAPRPDQALVWGLGHVAALEHADRWGGLADLPAPADGSPPDAATIRHLLATVAARTPGREDQVALRPAGPLGRRLRRAEP
ncbi:hypothetical protein AB8B12_26925, partial [Streptomyces sp. PGLac3x]